jgi:UDP-N-acetylmuramoyl-tripeptide--D-alanyl-D-alanine ligase
MTRCFLYLRAAVAYLLTACAFVWRRLMFRTTFIAITGSVGKSTASASLGAILSAHAATNWVPGGRNNRLVLARTILRTRFRHRFTVIEVGTRAPGNLQQAARMIAPDIVVMLGVRNIHSNAFPTLEAMAAEKEQLLRRLGKHGVAVVNADDPLVMAMQAQCPGPVRTFGRAPGSFVTASEVSSKWPRTLSFRAHCGEESSRVETNLVGEHMVYSALGALAAAVHCGVPLAKAAASLGKVQPGPGRMQPMRLPSGAMVLRDDFNGTLPTFEAALAFLRDAEASRRIVVAGDLLDTGLSVRARARLIGRMTAAAADMVVIVGDRSDLTTKAAVEAGLRQDAAFAFQGLPETARFLKAELREGDLVLVKGWVGKHIERVILAQLGSISCWVVRCNKLMVCETCPELKLVSISSAGGERGGGEPGGGSDVRHHGDLSQTSA